MRVSLVVAVNRKLVIGDGGKLPWHHAEDLRRFKKLTLGNTVVMGRNTWLTLPRKPLGGRHNVVLSTRPSWLSADEGMVVNCPEAALTEAEGVRDRFPQCFIIGGAMVYRSFRYLAETIYLSLIYDDSDGDARFSEYLPGKWITTRGEGVKGAFFLTLEKTAPEGATLLTELLRLP